jgi:Uma2 family endonuclease
MSMSIVTPIQLTARDAELASERNSRRYELIDGELKEKEVGFWALFIAVRIAQHLNAQLYPHDGAAAVEVMIYCFDRPNHGRKPDVVYVRNRRFPGGVIPDGDIRLAPDLVVEVLSPGNSGIELEDKLDEYLAAGIGMVWIVNPERKTIRIYKTDGTTRLYRRQDVICDEPLLPGFKLVVGQAFPEPPGAQVSGVPTA